MHKRCLIFWYSLMGIRAWILNCKKLSLSHYISKIIMQLVFGEGLHETFPWFNNGKRETDKSMISFINIWSKFSKVLVKKLSLVIRVALLVSGLHAEKSLLQIMPDYYFGIYIPALSLFVPETVVFSKSFFCLKWILRKIQFKGPVFLHEENFHFHLHLQGLTVHFPFLIKYPFFDSSLRKDFSKLI